MDILIMGAAGMIGGKSTEQLAKGGALRSALLRRRHWG
jgi:uncharacterized protein YbjT (DUF2867 family)